MIKGRLALIAGLFLVGSAIAGPGSTHAEGVATSGCASGSSPAMLSPYMTFSGRATNALPVPLTAASTVPPAISVTGTENPPVVIPTPATVVTSTIVAPQEYGLFNYIAGVKPVVFPGAVNELSDFFTFNSTATKVTDMPGGLSKSSLRTGTFGVYLGHGDFSNPATFWSGTSVLTATFTQTILVTSTATSANAMPGSLSVNSMSATTSFTGATALSMLNLPTNPTFTSQSTATITSTSPFTYGGACYQFGALGQKLTMSAAGQFDSPTAASASINGAITASST